MFGESLDAIGLEEKNIVGHHFAVKAPVFPFDRFPGVDVLLGPEMRSTGEVMGLHRAAPIAFAKALMSAGLELPVEGTVFLSVRSSDQRAGGGHCSRSPLHGFELSPRTVPPIGWRSLVCRSRPLPRFPKVVAPTCWT